MIIANKTKLNFRFYNPNTEEETTDYIARIFIEVNQVKIERVLQETAEQLQIESNREGSHSE